MRKIFRVMVIFLLMTGHLSAAPVMANSMADTCTGLDCDLEAFYHFDDPSGPAMDSFSNNNLEEHTNIPSVVGRYGNARYVQLGNRFADFNQLDFSNSFTLGGWIKLKDSAAPYFPILSKGTHNNGFYVEIQNTTSFALIAMKNDALAVDLKVSPAGGIHLDQWYFIAITFDKPTLTTVLRVNSQSSTYTGKTLIDTVYQENQSNGELWLGNYFANLGLHYYGYFDEWGKWLRALDSSELDSLNSGNFPNLPTDSQGNMLSDGGMEQQPLSVFWFPEGSPGIYDGFGRIDHTNLAQSNTFGLPRCAEGFQIVGNWECSSVLDFYCFIGNLAKNYTPIRQRFNWPGGRMFYRFSVRGGSPDRPVPYQVYVKNISTQTITTLKSGYTGPSDKNNILSWDDINGVSSASMTAGLYDFVMGLGPGAGVNDTVFFDDAGLDTAAISAGACQQIAPSITSTPTQYPTPTVMGVPGANLIENCGFSQGGLYWTWDSPRAFVVYQQGTNGNYGHENTDTFNPGIGQVFYWPGGIAYVKFQTDTAYNVYLVNQITAQVYPVLSGPKLLAGWVYYQAPVNLPAGTYELALHFPSGSGPGEFDNITVNAVNYGSCEAGTSATQTPYPTSTQNNTPTMWPTSTQRPTSTTMPGTATSTARPTNTPFPTFTPYSSPWPTITPNPFYTYTPYPTYTKQPTYTPFPTSTTLAGTATSTPIPPSQTPPAPPPPPGYYTPCDRPQSSTDTAAWLEYEKCQMLSFFSMSPNAISTVQALPHLMDDKEPMGTFKEVQDTSNGLKQLVDQYDWNNTGLPGVNDPLNPDQFINGPAGNSPLKTGHFDFTSGAGTPISNQCENALTVAIGPLLTPGACFVFNALRITGVLPWVQLMLDLTCIGVLILYIYKKWIDAGAN